MRLELEIFKIEDVQLGDKTVITDNTLFVNKEELISLVRKDERLYKVEVELARPGEEVRIIPVKDVIEPRVKCSGGVDFFPGILSKVYTSGSGRTIVLRGAALVTCGRIIGYQEGLIDMSGPAAKYSPFSRTNNIVLVLHPIEGLAPHSHEEAVRIAGLRASTYLASCVKDVTTDEIEICETKQVSDAAMPRIAYVYPLLSEGLLHNTYLYGVDAKQILPTLIHPNEVMDGAIVSGNCVSACDKHTTYHHLNNPIIRELYKRHGTDLNFVGVVITNLNVTLSDKQRSSDYASKLVKLLGADGAIISKEGFGNPDNDVMMICKKLEEFGIKTVLITDEFAGKDGGSQSLTDVTPQADAVISVGNANELITLPPMSRVIGHLHAAETIAGGYIGCLTAVGGLNTEIQSIIGATCQLGFGNLTAKEF